MGPDGGLWPYGLDLRRLLRAVRTPTSALLRTSCSLALLVAVAALLLGLDGRALAQTGNEVRVNSVRRLQGPNKAGTLMVARR